MEAIRGASLASLKRIGHVDGIEEVLQIFADGNTENSLRFAAAIYLNEIESSNKRRRIMEVVEKDPELVRLLVKEIDDEGDLHGHRVAE